MELIGAFARNDVMTTTFGLLSHVCAIPVEGWRQAVADLWPVFGVTEDCWRVPFGEK